MVQGQADFSVISRDIAVVNSLSVLLILENSKVLA